MTYSDRESIENETVLSVANARQNSSIIHYSYAKRFLVLSYAINKCGQYHMNRQQIAPAHSGLYPQKRTQSTSTSDPGGPDPKPNVKEPFLTCDLFVLAWG